MTPHNSLNDRRLYKPGSLAYTEAKAHGGAMDIAFCRFASRSLGSLFDHVDYVVVPPGADIGFHVHGTDEEEAYVVMEGSGKMDLDGTMVRVEKGDVIVNPPGGGHGLVNDSSMAMTLVVIQCSEKRSPH